MSDVTFDEEQAISSTRSSAPAATQAAGIIGLMYRLGIAKTKGDANLIMGGIIVVCVVMTATMIVFVQPHPDAARTAALERDTQLMQAYQSQHPSQAQ